MGTFGLKANLNSENSTPFKQNGFPGNIFALTLGAEIATITTAQAFNIPKPKSVRLSTEALREIARKQERYSVPDDN